MHPVAILIARQHTLDVVGRQVVQEPAQLVVVADVDGVAPIRIHQPVVDLVVPAEVARELGEPQRIEGVRDDVGARVVLEALLGEAVAQPVVELEPP